MYNISELNLKRLHLTLEKNDPSNTANFEYSYIDGNDIEFVYVIKQNFDLNICCLLNDKKNAQKVWSKDLMYEITFRL